MENQGEYREQGDNPNPQDTSFERLPLRPAFRCYSLDKNNTIVAWFGYDNRNTYNVYVEAGPENMLGGNITEVKTAFGSGGVVTKFQPGLVQYAMSVK